MELTLDTLKSLEKMVNSDIIIASANNDSKALKSARIKLRIIREEMKNYEEEKA